MADNHIHIDDLGNAVNLVIGGVDIADVISKAKSALATAASLAALTGNATLIAAIAKASAFVAAAEQVSTQPWFTQTLQSIMAIINALQTPAKQQQLAAMLQMISMGGFGS